MKRYWLFVFETCYPRGGMSDFKESFDESQAAEIFIQKNIDKEKEWHIFDSKKNKIINMSGNHSEWSDESDNSIIRDYYNS